jgi:hypothetical protein
MSARWKWGVTNTGAMTGSSQPKGIALVLGSAALSALTLTACSPLPGATLDPVYFKVGDQAVKQPDGQHGDQPKTSNVGQSSPIPVGMAQWTGRYQDSRGAGGIVVSLVQGRSTVSGTWHLRTGGGGPLTGTLDAQGRRLQLRMENTAPECPGLLEGLMEVSETALVGTYQGNDCEGPVSNGRLELHPK